MKKLITLILVLIICAGLFPAAADDGTCVVRVPAAIQGLGCRVYVNGILTKADDTEILGGNAYTVKKGSDVRIVFYATAGYELQDSDTVTIGNIQSDTSVSVPRTVKTGEGFSLLSQIARLFELIRNDLKAFFGFILVNYC